MLLCQTAVEEYQGAQSIGGGHQNREKTVWGGLGHHGLDSGKKEGARPTGGGESLRGNIPPYCWGQKMLAN